MPEDVSRNNMSLNSDEPVAKSRPTEPTQKENESNHEQKEKDTQPLGDANDNSHSSEAPVGDGTQRRRRRRRSSSSSNSSGSNESAPAIRREAENAVAEDALIETAERNKSSMHPAQTKDPMLETPGQAEERAFKLRDEIRTLVAERYQIRETLKKTISTLRMEERQRRLMDIPISGSEEQPTHGSKEVTDKRPATALPDKDNQAGSVAEAPTVAPLSSSDPSGVSSATEEVVQKGGPVEKEDEPQSGGDRSSPAVPLSGQKRSRSELEDDSPAFQQESSGSNDPAADAVNTQPEMHQVGDIKPLEKRPRMEVDDRTKRRSKNLFGHLMGHLQKAKEHLEREKDTKQAERQQETELRVKEKIEKEKRAQSEVKIQTLKETELKLMERLKQIQLDIEAKELAALVCHLESHYKSMQNFIRTKADPTIFWKPKIATAATDVLQKETALEIESKIRSISKNLQPAV